MDKMSSFAETIFKRTYAFSDTETWDQCAKRVAKYVAGDNEKDYNDYYRVISTKKFMPGGRYLYSAGREIPQTSNCFLLKVKDSREGWGKLLDITVQALTTGGGVGINYSEIRGKGAEIKRYGGTSSGPISLMAMVNEVARHVMSGGKRRSALWAGLNWQHPDIEDFIKAKTWSTKIRALKEEDFNFPAILDMTNISVCLDDKFFKEIKTNEEVQNLYYRICKSMCKTGEPGFSVDLGKHKTQILRNPCCEVVSDRDEDVCNLGSVNLARIDSLDELEEVTRIGTRFLYMGTYVGWLPHQVFKEAREANRRIGLGIMGVHEWCLRNDLSYDPSGLFAEWLSVWKAVSNEEVKRVANETGGAVSEGVRAVAPTGTIGIIAETTTGIEPVFCRAYKRRYLDEQQKWQFQYVIDPTVKRLVDTRKMNPEDVEDTFTLATRVERRIAMQAFIQDYVDQAISSTINVPEFGEYGNSNAKKFADALLKYLPRLRGITVYPDGARAGQPITPLKYATAIKHTDVVFQESDERCAQGVCSI